MWIVFRDPKTIFNHLDKFVLELIEDEHIHVYQTKMSQTIGGRAHDFMDDVYFLQPFFTSKDDVAYFARRYTIWTP